MGKPGRGAWKGPASDPRDPLLPLESGLTASRQDDSSRRAAPTEAWVPAAPARQGTAQQHAGHAAGRALSPEGSRRFSVLASMSSLPWLPPASLTTPPAAPPLPTSHNGTCGRWLSCRHLLAEDGAAASSGPPARPSCRSSWSPPGTRRAQGLVRGLLPLSVPRRTASQAVWPLPHRPAELQAQAPLPSQGWQRSDPKAPNSTPVLTNTPLLLPPFPSSENGNCPSGEGAWRPPWPISSFTPVPTWPALPSSCGCSVAILNHLCDTGITTCPFHS